MRGAGVATAGLCMRPVEELKPFDVLSGAEVAVIVVPVDGDEGTTLIWF